MKPNTMKKLFLIPILKKIASLFAYDIVLIITNLILMVFTKFNILTTLNMVLKSK